MLVLALDTTTRCGSSAVLRDAQLLRQDTSDRDRAHATRLPADLMLLLAQTGVRLRDIDVYAVATGPGSFTGLRIGIAAMQGLAFALGRPLIGVSAFDALASIAGPGRVATWVDAWRGDVYASLYQDGVAQMAPLVTSPTEFLSGIDRATTFIGDGAETYREWIERSLGPLAHIHATPRPPLAATIARLAAERAHAGDGPGPHMIRPVYAHRPDHQRFREARRVE